MKVIFVSLLLIALVSARSAVNQDIYAEFPECPISDPLKLVQVPINATYDPIIKLLAGSSIIKLNVEGLSTFQYNIHVNALTLGFSYDITIPRVSGKAKYTAEGYLDARPFRQETIPSGNFTGSGLAKFSATNIKLQGNGTIVNNEQGKIQLGQLLIHEESFDSLEMDLGPKFRIGGRPVKWRDFNRNIKSNFDRDFAENKGGIEGRIMEAANGILKNYTLQELIRLPEPPKECDSYAAY